MKRRRLQAGDYTVGWICALPIELAAAQEMLDDDDDLPQYSSNCDIYTLGRIGDHNVVLACLPAGRMGPQSAAAVAARKTSKFKSIRLGLMVGIGGGVPSDEWDVRLGDVVISQPHLLHGGVVQYDFGKTGAGGRIIRTGWLNAPPAMLLNAVSELRALRYRGQSKFTTYLSTFDKLKTFNHDTAGPDVLFEATYNHIGGATCEQCSKEREVKRTPRKGQEVVIHYGTIASGNQVMKDGVTRDRISTELGGVMCFEMEAAGLMNDFPCLVIRGICDYADSHKNKKWQAYAAATAAACAKEILTTIPAANHPQSMPQAHFLVPFPRNSRFVGRASHLDQLEKKLFPEGRQRIAIYGLGGVGKTQIVLESAYRTRERRPTCSIFWMQASSVEKVEQAYLEIGQALQIPGIDKEEADVKWLVKQKLSQETAGNWLLILDNADDADMWFKEAKDATWSGRLVDLLPRSSKGSVVWTTRDGKGALKMAPSQDVLSIREMEESVAIDLLQKSLISPKDVDNTQICARLLHQLTYLPLAIVQSASYINANEISIAEYLSLLGEAESTTIDMLSEDFEDDGRYTNLKNPVATTWLISFEQIRKRNTLAAEYLSFMCCLDANGIPQSILPQTVSNKEMTDAIGTLGAYSFITKRAASALTHLSADNQAFDLHRLVRLATRNWLRAQNELEQWTERVIARLADTFPTDEHMNKSIWTIYLPHALCICFCDVVNKNGLERSRLLEKIGLCLQAEGRYKEAYGPIMEALQVREKALGPKDPDVLTSVSNLGSVLEKQGKYEEAEAMHRRGLEVSEKIFGAEHPYTLISITHLGSVLEEQGKYEEAEAMHRRDLEVSEKIFGAEHRDTLISISHLGSVLSSQGNYKEAEAMHRRALEGFEKALGTEHPDTLISISHLGSVLSSQGNYKEAEAMHRRALEGYEKALGTEHPDTLSSVSHIGLVLENQGNYKEAEAMHRRALEGREKALGEEHPATLTSMSNLASTLWDRGRWKEAEELEAKEFEICSKVLGPEHPDTLISMNNVAFTRKRQGRYQEALALMEDCLRLQSRTLGQDHPRTMSSLSVLSKWRTGIM